MSHIDTSDYVPPTDEPDRRAPVSATLDERFSDWTGREPTRVFDAQGRHIEERKAEEGPDWQPRRDPVLGITE